MIDLRSDTVTLPTAAMMTAISQAPLGDDVYGEDPTVGALERHVAELLGFEAGLFVASGTMGNLCAMLAHCPRGARVIAGDESHIYRYEAGGASVLGGLFLHPLANTVAGDFDLNELEEALESPDDAHVAPAGLVALENTHNRRGGVALSPAHVEAVVNAAHAQNVPVHIDGARLFNAAVAQSVPARALIGGADSVQICFSKGLCAPVGSMLVGSKAFIHSARRIRKMLGGGMRQVGVIAAACRVAIETMVERLADDHAHAQRLAAVMSEVCGSKYRVQQPMTNLVVLHATAETQSVEPLVAQLREEGVLVGTIDARRLRAVTHHGIGDAAIERACSAFRHVLSRPG
jgi:threonine aldolase